MDSKETILLLEDDSRLRTAILQVLQNEGFQVIAADNAENAISAVCSANIGLIIIDVPSSGLSYPVSLSAMLLPEPKTAVLFITPKDNRPNGQYVSASELWAYLSKPFEPASILPHIQLLRSHNLHQQPTKDRQQKLKLNVSTALNSSRADTASSPALRTLLDLGTAWMHIGYWPSAARVFQHLARQGSSDQKTTSLLCLAEIARILRRYTEVRAYITDAIAASWVLGPASIAKTRLNGGICLMLAELPEARHCLESSLRILQQLELQPYVSRAAQALENLQNQPRANPVPFFLSCGDTADNPTLAADNMAISQVCEKTVSPYMSSSPSPMLKVSSLGKLSISSATCILTDQDWLTNKAKYLFIMLLCHSSGLSEDKILDELWPGNWEKGKQNLYHATSCLRRALKKLLPSHSALIQRRSGLLYWKDTVPLWFDIREVRRLASKADNAESADSWLEIIRLLQGQFLPDCTLNWAEAIRSEMASLQRSGLQWLSNYYLQRQQSANSLNYARCLLKMDSTDQPACELALRAYLQLGQPDKAVRLYQRFSANLLRELNAAPTTALIKLYHQAKMGLSC
ncbi:MAG: response regulator [bacterium]|nr:response regulator [bacterium]